MAEENNGAHIPVRRRKPKNRPKDTAWRQQRYPSFRPVLNAKTAVPLTLVLGLVCSGIGIFMYLSAINSLEFVIEYTNCIDPQTRMSEENSDVPTSNIQCMFPIELKENFTGNVTFYYGLEGFYQNTRLYMASRSEKQFNGDIFDTTGCSPLINGTDPQDGSQKPYAPCGIIADSMFNDTFTLSTDDNQMVPFTARNITYKYVKDRRFKNPEPGIGENLCDAFKGTVKPLSWTRALCMLGPPSNVDEEERESIGTGFLNVDLIVWMRPAALPKFRKIYRKLDYKRIGYENGLPAGNYTLQISYNYPTASWQGRKFFYITAAEQPGGRNKYLAIAYMVAGVFLLLVSAIFLMMSLRLRFLDRKRTEARVQ